MGKFNADNCDTLVESKALLDLQVAVSGVQNVDPQLYNTILARNYHLNRSRFIKRYLVLGSENLTRNVGDPNLPIVLVYNTKSGKLTLTDEVFLPEGLLGEELSNSASTVAISPKHSYILVGVEQFNNDQTQTKRTDTLYCLNDSGKLVPVETFDPYALFDIDPQTTAIGNASFSDDGKYIVFVAAEDSFEVAMPKTKLLFASLKDQTVVPLFEANVPPVCGTNVLTSTPPVFYKDSKNKNIWNLFLGGIATNFEASALDFYKINFKKTTVKLVQREKLNQFIFALALHPCKERLIVGTNQSACRGVSSERTPPEPLSRKVTCPCDELRLYAIHDCLHFIAGYDSESRIQAAEWSYNGKFLAITTSPYLGLPVESPGSTAPVIVRPTGTVHTLSYDQSKDTLRLEDTSPTSPAPFALAWNPYLRELAVGGQPTPVQNNILLFNIESVCRQHKKDSCSDSSKYSCSDSSKYSCSDSSKYSCSDSSKYSCSDSSKYSCSDSSKYSCSDSSKYSCTDSSKYSCSDSSKGKCSDSSKGKCKADWLKKKECKADWLKKRECKADWLKKKEPKADWLKKKEPKADWLKKKEPKADWLKKKEPKADWLKKKEPKADWLKKKEPKADWLKKKESKADWLKKKEPKADWLKKRECKADWLKKRECKADWLKKRECKADWLKK